MEFLFFLPFASSICLHYYSSPRDRGVGKQRWDELHSFSREEKGREGRDENKHRNRAMFYSLCLFCFCQTCSYRPIHCRLSQHCCSRCARFSFCAGSPACQNLALTTRRHATNLRAAKDRQTNNQHQQLQLQAVLNSGSVTDIRYIHKRDGLVKRMCE